LTSGVFMCIYIPDNITDLVALHRYAWTAIISRAQIYILYMSCPFVEQL
jgi:hypothetical protein